MTTDFDALSLRLARHFEPEPEFAEGQPTTGYEDPSVGGWWEAATDMEWQPVSCLAPDRTVALLGWMLRLPDWEVTIYNTAPGAVGVECIENSSAETLNTPKTMANFILERASLPEAVAEAAGRLV